MFKTVESAEKCLTLDRGSAVYCDRRFFANGVLWFHCMSNSLFDSDDARPENSECTAIV